MRRSVAILSILTIIATVTPASALTKAQIRDVQEKLTLLGYEPGPIDGIYGAKSRTAVRAFQEAAEIKVDGKVGKQTLGALEEKAASRAPEPSSMSGFTAQNNQLDIYDDILSERLASGSTALPTRYGSLSIVKGSGSGIYEVSLNGQMFASSPAGTGLPRVSHTYHVPGEDVMLLTASSSDRSCPVKNIMIVVQANGIALPPSEIGNCEAAINGRVQDRQVVFSFPPHNVESWRLAESWVYENGKVEPR